MKEMTVPVFIERKTVMSHQYYSVLNGLRGAASRAGARLRLIEEDETEQLRYDSLPSAAIVVSVSMPYIRQIVTALRGAGRGIVLAGIDSEQFGQDVSCATPSRRAGTRQLVDYLFSCGRERLALVGFGQNSINDVFRYHTALSAAAGRGHPILPRDGFLWQHDPQESFDAFLRRAREYDCVICPNDIISVCFINACRRAGIRIPEDLYLASFGGMTVGEVCRPSITSLSMDMVCVGDQAFNVWRFLNSTDNMRGSALKITVPSRILVRESTNRIPAEQGPLSPDSMQPDRFYYNPTISVVVDLDNCLSRRDELDMRIIRCVIDRLSYEKTAELLFLSVSTLRYRLSKIFSDAGVRTRQEFEALVHTYLGEGNPFGHVLTDA